MLAFPLILLLAGGGTAAWLLTQTDAGRGFVTPQQAAQPKTPAPITITPQLAPPNPANAVETRLAAIEGRMAALEARGVGGSAGKADDLLITFAARNAIEGGTPLGRLEGELRTRFGPSHGRAVDAILGAATNPTSIEKLTQQLTDLQPALAGANPDGGWWSSFKAGLGNLIVIRDANTPPDNPAGKVNAAKQLLASGQIEAAITQISSLQNRARATDWMASARRLAEAQDALDELVDASLGSAADVQPPMPVPPPAVPPNPPALGTTG